MLRYRVAQPIRKEKADMCRQVGDREKKMIVNHDASQGDICSSLLSRTSATVSSSWRRMIQRDVWIYGKSSFTGAFPSRQPDTLFFQTNLVARRTEFRTYGCSTIGRIERMQFSYANAISWHRPPRSFSRQTFRKSKLQKSEEVGLETISVWLRCKSSSIFYAAATENVKTSTIIWIVIAILNYSRLELDSQR